MRRFWILVVLILLCAFPAHGQSTTVSGTITDSSSQTWNNGSLQFVLIPNPLYPTSVYTWTGGTLSRVITGSLSGTGTYSVSIPSNSAITPTGSKWVLQVTPNATFASFSTAATTITGSTQTLNATPPAIFISWSNPPGPALSAYSDSEIGGTLVPGAEYFNTTTLLTRVWNGSAWNNQGAGSGGTCTSVGAAGVIQKSNGAGGCLASSITDNGTTVATTEPLTANSISTPAPTPGVVPITATVGSTCVDIMDLNANGGTGGNAFKVDCIGDVTAAFGLVAGGNIAAFGHLDQGVTKDFAGTCAMVAGTTCTFTLNASYNGTPICIATEQGTSATVIAAACSVVAATGVVTITAASSNSATWGAVIVGNPT
jgi:hypothetical protein